MPLSLHDPRQPLPSRRLLMAHPYLSDRAQAVYASSSASGSMPVQNLLTQQPTEWWRSASGVTDASVTIHLPTEALLGFPLEWSVVAPLYTNAGPDALMRVVAAETESELDNDPAPYDSLWLPARPWLNMDRPGEPSWRHSLLFAGDATVLTYEWARIYWSDPAPIGGDFIQWGRLYVSLPWRPSYHHDRGSGLTPALETPRRAQTQGGQTRFGRGSRPRKFRFNVAFLSQDEADSLAYELDRIVGASGDLLVVDDPADVDHGSHRAIMGTIEPGELRHDDFDSYSRAYTITEML